MKKQDDKSAMQTKELEDLVERLKKFKFRSDAKDRLRAMRLK